MHELRFWPVVVPVLITLASLALFDSATDSVFPVRELVAAMIGVVLTWLLIEAVERARRGSGP